MQSKDGMRPERKDKSGKKARIPAIGRRDFLLTSATAATAGAGLVWAQRALAQDAATAPAPAEPAPAPAEAAAPAAPAPEAAAPVAPPAEAAAAPAAAAAPLAGPEPNRKSTDPLNIAIFGYGQQGGVLVESILNIPNIRFKALCDIWDYSRNYGYNTLTRKGHELRAYEDYQELLATETDLDAVVVATPDFMHAEHAIACMNKGYHVYCEKEMSNDVEKAREMVRVSRATNRLLQIGHQRRSNPRYIHAINRLIKQENMLGRITHANGQWNRAKSVDIPFPPKFEMKQEQLDKYGYDSMQQFRNWRWYKKYGGGPIVDLGSHQIDIFTWVFGAPPKAVQATGGVDFYPHHEWYDNVLCLFDFETPVGYSRAFYQVLTTSSNGQHYESFMGEDGTLMISEVVERGNAMLQEKHANKDFWDRLTKEGLLKNSAATPAPAALKNVAVDSRETPELGKFPLPIELNKPAHQPHLENFFDAVRNGTPLNCPGEIGLETAVVVHKINQAVAEGRKMYFEHEEFQA